jgi:hypothetical protein
VIKRGDKAKPSPAPAAKARRSTTDEKLQKLIDVQDEENNSLKSDHIPHDMESEYDSGSQHSSSTFNDTKNLVDPYSSSNHSPIICRIASSLTSILRPSHSYLKPQTI